MNSIALPQYYRTQMSNGMIVYVMPHTHLPLVSFRMMFFGGAALDCREDAGCANLVSTVLNKGSESYDAVSFVKEVEQTGGILSAFAHRDCSLINGEFLRTHFSKGVELLSEMVRGAVLPPMELEKSKRQITEELIAKRDDPSYLANLHFKKLLFNDHPYGQPIRGNETTIKAISREKCIALFQRHYQPDRAVIVIVGDCGNDEALSIIENNFGGWRANGFEKNSVGEASASGKVKIRIVDKPDATQTQIRLGNIGICRNDSAYYPVSVMNNIFGGSFTSRLVGEIRVKRGLSYGVWSRFTTHVQKGEYLIGTFTKHESVGDVIDIILTEMHKMQTEKLADGELAKSKKYITGLFPFSLELPENWAAYLADIELYRLNPDYISQHCARILAVQEDDIRNCAQKYLPLSNPVIVAAGAASEIQKALERFGNVEIVPYTAMV